MNKQFRIALYCSVAAHAAVLGVCPSPHSTRSGQDGNEQDLVVLGVMEFTPREQEQQEHPDTCPAIMPTQPPPPEHAEPVPPEPLAKVSPTRVPPSVDQQEEPAEPTKQVPRDVTPATPGRQSLSRGALEDMRSRYLRGVMRKLECAKRYPLHARRHGMEGTVELGFTILADGRAIDISLHRSSRYPALNNAARNLVARAAPFGAIPEELDQAQIKIDVPVVFQIRTP